MATNDSSTVRWLPLVDQLRTYRRSWLRGDLVAGMVVVAALIVPKNLGYAGIAGVPLENGLYAAAAGALLYGVFGTCRRSRWVRAPAWPRSRPALIVAAGSPPSPTRQSSSPASR